jgi:hypothetical protein
MQPHAPELRMTMPLAAASVFRNVRLLLLPEDIPPLMIIYLNARY